MKKLLLCGTALLLSISFMNAQGVTGTGAYDDFATATPYSDITWKTGTPAQLSIARAAGGLTVTGTTGPDASPYIGADFATSINCQTNNNADVIIDIENTSGQFLFMDVRLVDGNGNQATIEPNIADVTPTTTYADNTGAPNYYTHRKADNAFPLYGHKRKTFTIDLSSVPANLGGLTWASYGGTKPYDSPNTSHTIDPSDIVGIVFNVNYGTGSFDISLGDSDPVKDSLIGANSVSRFTGTFVIHSLKVGTVVTGVNESAMIDRSLKVYPNPAKDALTVSFEAVNGADVILTDLVGNTVFTGSASAGENKLTLNTSGLLTGMYILNVATEDGRVARKVTIK